jgi:murein DD-endopeptidase MepM/ murein hydrolase activator NlpD
MPRVVELLRSWSHPRMIVLTAMAVTAAGCSSETSRFNDGPSATRSAPNEVTGSVPASRQAPVSRVETSALPPPAPARSATASTPGIAGGGRGMATYQPGTTGNSDYTGSVQAPPPPAPAPVAQRPTSNGQWSWDGGTAVTVAQGETVEVIARRHAVPPGAILQANNLSAGQAIYPGQRLVIPRYNTQSVAAAPAARPAAIAPGRPAPQAVAALSHPSTPVAGVGVHVVAPGETLTKISHIYNKSLVELAKANNIQPHTKLTIGDKIIIPGMRVTSAPRKDTPKVAEAQPLPNLAPAKAAPAPAVVAAKPAAAPAKTPAGKQAAVPPAEPTQSAAMVTPANDTPVPATAAKAAEGNAPSFRWPVKARVIAGFGPKTNGQQNDGINLAVPEGTPVKAAEDGVVAYAGSELKGYGNLVLIRHSNGYVTAYAHAKELMVKRGDTIKRGQVVAKSGQTGNVEGPQLHFEIRKGPAPMDPLPMLSGG